MKKYTILFRERTLFYFHGILGTLQKQLNFLVLKGISMDFVNKLFLGDCEDVLKKLPDNSMILSSLHPLMLIKGKKRMAVSVLIIMLHGLYRKRHSSRGY